jgi:hypothetical protein
MESKKDYLMVVGWKRYFDRRNHTVYTYMSKYGERLYRQMYTKLKSGIRYKSPYIILIKFQNSDVVSIVYRDEYETVLKNLLNTCISMEYYELCADITKTLNSLNRPKRKPRKKNNQLTLK